MSDNNEIKEENNGKRKLSFKELLKKWWFWVIIAAVVIIIIVASCVGANRSIGVIGGADGPISVEQLDDKKDKHESTTVYLEFEEEINSVENQPQNDKQKYALNYAMEAVKYSYKSYDSVVYDLEEIGYSHEDAVYAADNCGADWNEVASLRAVAYSKAEGRSRIGLIDMLMGDGFSEENAIYAADNAGIDYSNQAKLKALEYLSVEKFEKEKLVEILVGSFGFTEEEASLGADAALQEKQ